MSRSSCAKRSSGVLNTLIGKLRFTGLGEFVSRSALSHPRLSSSRTGPSRSPVPSIMVTEPAIEIPDYQGILVLVNVVR